MQFSYIGFIKGMMNWKKIFLTISGIILIALAIIKFSFNIFLPIILVLVFSSTLITIEIKSIKLTKKLIERNIDFFKDKFQIDYNDFLKVKTNINDSIIAIRVDNVKRQDKIFLEKFIEVGVQNEISKMENGCFWTDKKNNGMWVGEFFDSNDLKITEDRIKTFLTNFK